MPGPDIYNVIVGTAGHIDHGKSSVVRHLTGIDPDRLPEEKNRGLTIDLGFAPIELSTGERVGIIDVPGHERFIKNMVAGASGIDLVMLVVAADDSVMPQTREHLAIMRLLGLERGIIVINKIDLVEEEMIELVQDEIEELTAGTFLEGAPVFPVSAVTGAGIDAFRQGLEREIHSVERHDAAGIFRMPIQRVFSAKGHGTVLTGIPVSGAVDVGDTIEVLPLGQTGRVRSLQAYKASVDHARAGHSTAINVGDIDYHDVHRGMVAAQPGFFRATRLIEARVQILASLAEPVTHQMPVRFHTGTLEVVGKLYLLEGKSAMPGQQTYAQFRLDESVVVCPGDRYVFRQQSPMITLGGGEVLDRSEWRLKSGKDFIIESLERKQAALGSPTDFVASLIESDPAQLFDRTTVAPRVGMAESRVAEIFDELAERGDLQASTQHGRWFATAGLEFGCKRVRSVIEGLFKESPHRLFVSKLEVKDRCRFDAKFFDPLLSKLAEVGKVRLEPGGRVTLPDRKLDLSPGEQKAYEVVSKAFASALFSPTSLEELSSKNNLSVKLLQKMQSLLIEQEVLCRVSTDIVLHVDAIDTARGRIQELFEAEGAFTASRAKDVLETSRKFAIPLLEYFDSVKLTVRVGDKRELRTQVG